MRNGCALPEGACPARKRKKGNLAFVLLLGWSAAFLLVLFPSALLAAEPGSVPLPSLQLGIAPAESPGDVALSLQILGLLTVLSLAPAILLMITSFTRIVVVLGFVQRAIGLQQSPPQQVITGLNRQVTIGCQNRVHLRIAPCIYISWMIAHVNNVFGI